MIYEKISRERVNGFLHAVGRTIQNGNNEEILLTGWGLGNWLNPEGYMWKSGEVSFSRGREAEKSIRELAGEEYAQKFWKQFRANYITKKDIEKMAEFGYNSVRIPINWRLFMEERPGEIIWKDEGFVLLDNCIQWCREYKLYAWIDLHAAPGGQTGSNIDDSEDDLPRLFMNDDYYKKGLALWRELANRYKDEWIVGGYDLLNEPIMPNDGNTFDQYIPKLKQFYHDAIRWRDNIGQRRQRFLMNLMMKIWYCIFIGMHVSLNRKAYSIFWTARIVRISHFGWERLEKIRLIGTRHTIR